VVNTRTLEPSPIESCGTLLLGQDHWRTPRVIGHGSKVFVPSVNPIWNEKQTHYFLIGYLFFFDLTISFILLKKIECYENKIGDISLRNFVISSLQRILICKGCEFFLTGENAS
jgi:hypothetical protein